MMLNNQLTIFINTHTSAADCWPVFFGQLKQFWPARNWPSTRPQLVVAVNGHPHVKRYTSGGSIGKDPLDGLRTIGAAWFADYSGIRSFTSQYLAGLCRVDTPFVITLQEDMFLYGRVDEEYLREQVDWLRGGEKLSCVRLIDSGRGLHYSMQASIWKTWRLKMLYASAVEDTPWDAEIAMNARMMQGECEILDCDGPKRGNHRDSTQFPYTATALVRGKWNRQYEAELLPMLAEYGVNPSKRGWTE